MNRRTFLKTAGLTWAGVSLSLPLEAQSRSVKIVLVGEGGVGKTCMIISYATNEFPRNYIPTVVDTMTVPTSGGGTSYSAALWDTAGDAGYDRIRPLSYRGAGVFMVVFSVASPSTLDRVADRWLPEIRATNPKTPILLVGNKRDLRSEKRRGVTLVTNTAAASLASRIGAKGYRECSALTQEGLKEVMVEACRIGARQ